MPKFDPQKVKEMRRLYEDEHWSLRELAAKFGLTHEGVRYKLLKGGTEMRDRKIRPHIRPRVSVGKPINLDELRRLHVDELMPVIRIAKRWRVDPARVRRELDLLGIERRPRGFYVRKHPELASLKVGEWIDVPPSSPGRSRPHSDFYSMALWAGIRISIRRVAEGLYRLTRTS